MAADNPNYKTRLQAARKLAGLTIEQLAEKAEVNLSTVNTLDNGERPKRRLANYFGVPLEEMFPR